MSCAMCECSNLWWSADEISYGDFYGKISDGCARGIK